jgi:non-heme chloroperoxidase
MSKLTTSNVDISHRKILIGGACMAAAASLSAVTMAATAKQANVSTSSKQSKGGHTMNTITTKGGTQIY